MATSRSIVLAQALAMSFPFSCEAASVGITPVVFSIQRIPGGESLEVQGKVSRASFIRLYAKFRILIDENVLKALKESGYLSVRVEWVYNGAVKDTIELGISQEKWDAGESDMSKRVSDDGVFAFRTATFRTYVPAGLYRIQIRDKAGNLLSPASFDGPGIYSPSIEVIAP